MHNTENLKQAISITQVVESLGGLGLKSSCTKLQGNCPTGHQSKSGTCFNVMANQNYFYCFSCGIGGDIIDLVQCVQSIDFKSAVQWLNNTFQPAIQAGAIVSGQMRETAEQQFGLSHKRSQETISKETIQDFQRKAELFEQIVSWGKKLLYTPVAQQELDYLVNTRNYNRELLEKTDWFFLPADKEIRVYLSAQNPELRKLIFDFKSFKLQGYYGDIFRLALPYRNRDGIITGFIKRASCATGYSGKNWNDTEFANQRYDGVFHTAHEKFKKYDLFNLHACQDKKTVVITEGVADAAYLSTLGLDYGFAAVSQGKLSLNHLEGLQAFGIEHVIICFDNDKPNKSGHATGILNTLSAIELLQSAQIRASVVDPRQLEPYKDPEELVCNNGPEKLVALLERAQAGAVWKKEELARDISGDIQSQLRNAPILSQAATAEPPVSLFYSFADLINDIKNAPLGFKTGYKSLDEVWSIPNDALTIIAGRPGHGKTSLLLNLFLKLIMKNPEHAFFFFSYEVVRKQLLINLVNMLSNAPVSSNFNTKLIENYLMSPGFSQVKDHEHAQQFLMIETAKNSLELYTQNKRMGIIDQPFYVDELINYLKYIKDNYPVGVICIDYIQKIKLRDASQSRQVELQKISALLLEAATKLSLPIILGAQFNREVTSRETMDASKLREAGDLEQDANTVIGIWNEAKAPGAICDATNQVLDLCLLKNRNGRTGDSIQLNFNGPTLAISDIVMPEGLEVAEKRSFWK